MAPVGGAGGREETWNGPGAGTGILLLDWSATSEHRLPLSGQVHLRGPAGTLHESFTQGVTTR